MIQNILDINVSNLKQDYVRIENIDQYNIDIPLLHPDDPAYITVWRRIKKLIVEGMFGVESGGYRYAPPSLMTYKNLFLLEDTDANKQTTYIQPQISDLEWEIFYGLLEAEGFSGFYEDEKYTCDHAILDYDENDVTTHPEYYELRFFNSKGKLKQYISPREYIKMLHEKPQGAPLYFNEAKNFSILGCHHPDSKVRMYNGNVKCVKDIQEGDILISKSGEPTTVTEVFNGHAPMFKVDARYNDPMYVTFSHVLQLRKRKYKYAHDSKRKHLIYEDVSMTVEEYMRLPDSKKRYLDLNDSTAVQYPDKELQLNPYLLGLWLGDGFKREKLICVNQDKDKEILDWLVEHCANNDNLSYTTAESTSALSEGTTTRFRFIHKEWLHKGNWWSKTLKDNKHIPNEYMINSRRNRLELLAGMIDSDGNYDGKRYTITNTDLNLLNQFKYLARSLGFRAVINKPHQTGITDALKYNLRITGKLTDIPCKLAYKVAKEDNNFNKKGCNRNDFTITPIGNNDFVGFEVTGDRTYLMHDYLVDHNSRGGGKSYVIAGRLFHLIITDGARYYNEDDARYYRMPIYTEKYILEGKEHPVAVCVVGSGDTDKSSELLSKVSSAMNSLATEKRFGVWGESGDRDYTPCTLYKDMAGSLLPGNKKNAWRHKYKVLTSAGDIEEGTNSRIYHVSYSTNKATGSQAGAGGRYVLSVVEESGLTANTVEIHNSNQSAVSRNGRQFGTQVDLGTSGNIDAVQQTKRKFTDPYSYNIVAYDDVWEGSGKIGFFLPFYMTLRQYKDKDGNTIYEQAFDHVNKLRINKADAEDPSVLREEKMNRPIIPSEMWITAKGYYLPYEEAVSRQTELLSKRKYLDLASPVKLIWDSTYPNGVRHELNPDSDPFYDFPVKSDRLSFDGSVVIYAFPDKILGATPNDMYLVTLDPYVSENLTEGGSLGVCHVWLHPRYWNDHMPPTGPLVASYVAKPASGLDEYYLNVEKLLAFYGNPVQGLWFEANRGERCRDYFIKRKKNYLLAPRPKRSKSQSIYQRPIQEYGVILGNKIAKITALDNAKDFLLREIDVPDVNGEMTKKTVIETIADIFLINQIVLYVYEKDANFDAVSSMILYPIAEAEIEHTLLAERQRKVNYNKLTFLSMNPKIFSASDTEYKIKRFKEKYGFDEEADKKKMEGISDETFFWNNKIKNKK